MLNLQTSLKTKGKGKIFQKNTYFSLVPAIKYQKLICYIFIMQTNHSQRHRPVQNYQLENLLLDCQHCEFWSANHKILKKPFTLKRIKSLQVNKGSSKVIKNQQNYEDPSYLRAMNEINILKALKLEIKPKCHKLIRTNLNVYIVYDDFPGTRLSQHLSTTSLTINIKLNLMIIIAKRLLQVHSQGMVLLVLNPNIINIIDNTRVLFTDWTFAINIDRATNMLPFLKEFYAQTVQICQRDKTGAVGVDIYNLGKIFFAILNVGIIQKSLRYPNAVENLINRMISYADADRITLKDVISILNKQIDLLAESQQSVINKKDGQMELQTKTLRSKHSVSADDLLKPLRGKLKTYQRENGNESGQAIFRGVQKQRRAPTTITEHSDNNESYISIGLVNKNELSTNLSKSCLNVNLINVGKQISKRRNLAFFLFNLQEFVFKKEHFPQLAFILMKYALIQLRKALQEIQSFQNAVNRSQYLVKKQSIDILTDEIMRFKGCLTFLKRYCKQISRKESAFALQLQNQNAIVNEEYSNKKIRSFGRHQIETNSNTNIKQFSKMIENLFQTFMILKKLQFGSYQKFWDTVYKPNLVHLRNQLYFQEEKKLGLRNIKEKIQNLCNNQ